MLRPTFSAITSPYDVGAAHPFPIAAGAFATASTIAVAVNAVAIPTFSAITSAYNVATAHPFPIAAGAFATASTIAVAVNVVAVGATPVAAAATADATIAQSHGDGRMGNGTPGDGSGDGCFAARVLNLQPRLEQATAEAVRESRSGTRRRAHFSRVARPVAGYFSLQLYF